MTAGLTLATLVAMKADDFEKFRQDGWSSRQVLTQSVMNELLLPEGWLLSSENYCEYGGIWPVCLRYMPPHGRYIFVLTSPGEISDRWMLLLQSATGQRMKCLRRMEHIDILLINKLIQCADILDKKNYTLAGLCTELSDITAVAGNSRQGNNS
ncbi:conjugation system SOS inhibitor PsiB [Citrobacter amalonaticus]|uniref:conjugation system SOS inhibitor PsiB n=1 Tax=Citrobacter farmeri TaxID=67824 RepID=UPI00050FF151|nr:conjugation system SOS inhibitor PsiB [Citrobacter farmeri]MDB2166947.1 conjugation system SOS inhibitor PsiB [Citrobacter farmeri]QXA99845.1 conjugation system SOS inhibitor PsiB [Citrobacter farmeri]GAL51793.1 putative plasmid SOS inhibition protein PsiB [Citrobacter farmeri GTC 1319]